MRVVSYSRDGTATAFDGTNTQTFPSGPTQQADLVSFFAATDAAEDSAAKDAQLNAVDAATLKLLFRHENLLRELIRALRASSTAANTAANSAGLPTSANSADVTVVQFLAAWKSLL